MRILEGLSRRETLDNENDASNSYLSFVLEALGGGNARDKDESSGPSLDAPEFDQVG